MAASGRVLALPSGGSLDLDRLPAQATLEMLQACRDRIFALEAEKSASPAREPRTPAKKAAQRQSLVDTAGAASASKSLSATQIAKEKKSIVKEIKKRITPQKFHTGFDRVGREVKFAADRLPPEAAAAVLGKSCETWASPTITATLDGNAASAALSLEPDELKGSVWLKGGAQPGRRFGAAKPKRLGSAPLLITSLTMSYTVKSQRLTGSLTCINGSMPTGGKRQRSYEDDDVFGFGSLDTSDDDML